MYKHEFIYLDILCQHILDIILKIITLQGGYSNQTSLSCLVKSLFICIYKGSPALNCVFMAGAA